MAIGVYQRTVECREILSRAHRGAPLSEYHRRKISEANKGRKFSEEARRKMSVAHKGKIVSKETREKLRLLNFGKKHTEITKQKMSTSHTGRKLTEDHKRKISNSRVGKLQSPEHRQKNRESHIGKKLGHCSEERKRKIGSANSIILKKKWVEDQEYREMMRRAQGLSPNKTELWLFNFLDQVFPDKYEYVGDWSFFIGGKNPDFKHVSKKKVIEFNGDYWHKPEEEQPRIDYFKQYGYECLVVWEHELKDLKLLEVKLRDFTEEKEDSKGLEILTTA